MMTTTQSTISSFPRKREFIVLFALALNAFLFFSYLPASHAASLVNWPSKAKIITPDGDGRNDELRVYFQNPSGEIITGKVYNLYSDSIADMKVSLTDDYLYWDARDNNGSIATPGVYIYIIKVIGGENKLYSGALVVAR